MINFDCQKSKKNRRMTKNQKEKLTRNTTHRFTFSQTEGRADIVSYFV